MTPGRSRLPDRRPSHLETLEVGGQTITACVGFDPATGLPCEVFLNGGKEGSQFDAMLADAATIISVALQYGVRLNALAKSVGRAPNASTMPGSIDQLNAGSQPDRCCARSTTAFRAKLILYQASTGLKLAASCRFPPRSLLRVALWVAFWPGTALYHLPCPAPPKLSSPSHSASPSTCSTSIAWTPPGPVAARRSSGPRLAGGAMMRCLRSLPCASASLPPEPRPWPTPRCSSGAWFSWRRRSPGRVQHGLHERRLAARVGPNERGATRRRCLCLCHDVFPVKILLPASRRTPPRPS